MHRLTTFLGLTVALAALAACSGGADSAATTSSSGASSSGAGQGSASATTTSGATSGVGGGAAACVQMEVPCSDQAILELNFHKDPSDGKITNEADGAGYISAIDATAGGASAPKSYVYAKFTDKGLVAVAIGDEASLDSVDWDIAFRRFVIRINSGSSGPSCVKAARIANVSQYDKIVTLPENVALKPDTYFDAMCALIDDKSGLGNTPATELHTFWQYASCLQMTGNVYAISLADGRNVKLTVLDYYSPAVQDECNKTGMFTEQVTGSGNLRVRWALLP
jgi:HmuY protein